MMLWRSTTVIINNVVYCLRCIVQVHVVNQNYLMFIYYLYLIINDIYTWWEPWLVAFENRLMNSIQKKSRDHKSCDLKKQQRHPAKDIKQIQQASANFWWWCLQLFARPSKEYQWPEKKLDQSYSVMEYMDVYDEKALGYKVQILDWHGTLDVRKIEAVGPYKCGIVLLTFIYSLILER